MGVVKKRKRAVLCEMLVDLRKESRSDFGNGRTMGNIRESFSDTEGSGFHATRLPQCEIESIYEATNF